MAAFLSGLLRDPLLGEEDGLMPRVQPPPQPPRPESFVPMPEPQAAPRDNSPGGLLGQAAKWALSPRGMLAIGTTLRAGGGDANAFDDQRAQMGVWDNRRKEDEALADMAAKNEALTEAWIDDGKGGRKYSDKAYQAALAKKGYRGDQAAAIIAAKAMKDQPHYVQNEQGVWSIDEDGNAKRAVQFRYQEDPTKVTRIPGGAAPPGAATPAAPPAAPGGAPAPEAGAEPSPEAVTAAKAAMARSPVKGAGPTDIQQLARAIQHEAGGEPFEGKVAVGSVILNRVEKGGFGGGSITDVVNAPNQFEGVTTDESEVTPEHMALAEAMVRGEYGDPTGGAVNFLNPELQTKGWKGRPGAPIPSWGRGEGQRIGAHVFHGGDPSRGVRVAGPRPAMAPSAGGAAAAPAAAQVAQQPTVDADGYTTVAPAPAWEDLKPEEAQARGWSEGQRNRFTGETSGTTAPRPPGSGRLSAGVAKQQYDSLRALNVASTINTMMDRTAARIASGKLKLGILENTEAEARNFAGRSNEQSKAYATFRNELKKLQNESLLLNKGTQTDFDARQAWEALITNLHDPAVVRQRLEEIKGYNESAIAFHSDLVSQIREDAGLSPIDPRRFEAPALAEPMNDGSNQGGWAIRLKK